MVFTKKTATATATVDGVPAASKINLTDAFTALDLQFQGVIQESQSIPDSFLDQPVQDALKAVAELIGFTEYDAAEISTLYMGVRDADKKMYGPSLKAYADSAAIVWGGKRVVLAGDQSLGNDIYSIMTTEYGATVVVDAGGYCMPVNVSLDSRHTKQDVFKSFKTKLLTLRTPAALSEYLNRSEDLVKWSELEDGQAVEFHSLTPVYDREDATKLKYWMALAMVGDQPARMYAPGENEQWLGIEIGNEPIVLTKNGSIITDASGKTYEIKGSFVKLAELEMGIEYRVTGFSTKNGEYGLEVLLDVLKPNGEAVKVNGNAYIKQKLGSAPADEITPTKSATLVIDAIGKTKAGHAKVNCRLITVGDAESPMLKKLKEQQAKLMAEKQLAAPNPF